MPDDLNALAEIDECSFLFLIDLREGPHNSLHLQIAEGLPVGSPKSIKVADSEIPDCTAIEITTQSRVFEVVWSSYVGYSVLNESYATISDEEFGKGNRFRIYSQSRFMHFMSQSTFACDVYPGPTRHYCVACEDHILHVLSVDPPTVRRVRDSQSSSTSGEPGSLIH